MKRKTAIAGMAIGVMAVWATFEYGHAAPAATTASLNIGVVSIRAIVSTSQHQTKYRNALMARQTQLQAQLESRVKDIEAAEANLKTFVVGSDDYLKQLQVVLQKRGAYDGEKEYITQKRSLEDKEWMETLYQATLKIVADVAKEKGLDLVLERTEPQFPSSAEELMTTFSTHKVLYAGGCTDLTSEVLRRLDAQDLPKR